ncbi:MAG: hypothetical protein GY679_02195 [Mycoplasma sp.]|nr:hypothetical protein [Mycoplasma sp.]
MRCFNVKEISEIRKNLNRLSIEAIQEIWNRTQSEIDMKGCCFYEIKEVFDLRRAIFKELEERDQESFKTWRKSDSEIFYSDDSILIYFKDK